MVYEAVPEGVEIQKLTAAQRDALSRYKIHENINTFLANENVPLVLGGAVASYLAIQTSKSVIESLETELGKVSQGVKDAVDEGIAKVEKELVSDPKTWFERKLFAGKQRLEELDITRLA